MVGHYQALLPPGHSTTLLQARTRELVAQFYDDASMLNTTLVLEPDTAADSYSNLVERLMQSVGTIACKLERDVNDIGALIPNWELETDDDLRAGFACGMLWRILDFVN